MKLYLSTKKRISKELLVDDGIMVVDDGIMVVDDGIIV